MSFFSSSFVLNDINRIKRKRTLVIALDIFELDERTNDLIRCLLYLHSLLSVLFGICGLKHDHD